MYDILRHNPAASMSYMYAKNWNYIHAGLKSNLERVVTYYQNSPQAVAADHILATLLNSMTVTKTLGIERYYDNVDGLFSLNLAMALGMTTPSSKGRTFKGAFYGEGSTEYLMAHTAPFDPIRAAKNWKKLRPVRVLRHQKTNLSLNLPDGKTDGDVGGIAVIAINVPMLAVMYWAFWNQEYNYAQATGDSPRSVYQFIHMYVLPNMLYSHLDYVLFNRIWNLSTSTPNESVSRKNPFYLTDYSQQLNDCFLNLLGNLEKVSKDFAGILFNIPAVSRTNMLGVMEVPSVPPTRQITWLLAVSRIPMIDFLTHVSKESGITKNNQEINRVRRALREYENASTLRTQLGTAQYNLVADELERIKARI